MAIKDLKRGDKLYAVYSTNGFLFCDHIYECVVKKVITNEFVTRIYMENNGHGTGTKAVGYYTSNCALNGDYFFTTNRYALEQQSDHELDHRMYQDIKIARDRLMQFIKDGV